MGKEIFSKKTVTSGCWNFQFLCTITNRGICTLSHTFTICYDVCFWTTLRALVMSFISTTVPVSSIFSIILFTVNEPRRESWLFKDISGTWTYKCCLWKLCSKWVTPLSIVDQKQESAIDSELYLERFKQKEKSWFLYDFWLYEWIMDSLLHNSGWKLTKRPNTQRAADKVVASDLCDTRGIIFIDYLGMGKTVNSEYFMALLVRLEEITKKRPQMKKKNILL